MRTLWRRLFGRKPVVLPEPPPVVRVPRGKVTKKLKRPAATKKA